VSQTARSILFLMSMLSFEDGLVWHTLRSTVKTRLVGVKRLAVAIVVSAAFP
jgi:hypothetical protein